MKAKEIGIENIIADERNLIYSFQKAKEDYGVVINQDFSVIDVMTKSPRG